MTIEEKYQHASKLLKLYDEFTHGKGLATLLYFMVGYCMKDEHFLDGLIKEINMRHWNA